MNTTGRGKVLFTFMLVVSHFFLRILREARAFWHDDEFFYRCVVHEDRVFWCEENHVANGGAFTLWPDGFDLGIWLHFDAVGKDESSGVLAFVDGAE